MSNLGRWRLGGARTGRGSSSCSDNYLSPPMLLSPFSLGPLSLPNRVVLAPLTRSRHQDQVPTDLAPTYYAQRASAGLLIAEASQISGMGQGYPSTPGIYTDEQVQAWERVTGLVHAVGGRIVL